MADEKADASALEELLAEAIDLADAGDTAGIDALLAAHPTHRAEIRELLGSLDRLGLVGGETGAAPLEGGRLGAFRLLSKLGEGGMGVVYLARDTELDRVVAIKLLHPGLAASETARERFQREAKSVARLQHPNIVVLYATGEQDGRGYLVMQYVPGRGLDELLADGNPIPVQDCVAWIRDVAIALQTAHDAGVVHRDIKPSNLRITPDGRAILLDFGLARDAASVTLTRTGAFQGSPHYASPEQVEGERVGPATDVYSLGVTLYHAACGRLPFDGENAQRVFRQILGETPKPLRSQRADLPRDLETIVAKAIERDPAQRYASAADFAADLDALLTFRPIAARPAGPVRRARNWMRRHRLAAGSVIAVTLLAIALTATIGINRAVQRSADRRQAVELVGEARTELERYAASGAAVDTGESELAARETELQASSHPPSAWRAFAEQRNAVEQRRQGREAALANVRRLLDRARTLDPEVAGADAVEAATHMELWRAADARGDRTLADFHRDRAVGLAPDGRFADELASRVALSIASDPPGAEVFLFRYAEQSTLDPVAGEQRLVAVPAFAEREPTLTPGTWCLRVSRAVEPLRYGDLIVAVAGHPIEGTFLARADRGDVRRFDRLVAMDGVAIETGFDARNARLGAARSATEAETAESFVFARSDGSRVEVAGSSLDDLGIEIASARVLVESGAVPCTVLRRDVRLELDAPAGVEVRATASPLAIGAHSRAGTTPLQVSVTAGELIAVALREDAPPLRVPFVATPNRTTTLTLPIAGATADPPGFVPIVDPLGVAPTFWLCEHEVTVGEYTAFLNDDRTLAQIDAAAEPMLFPRHRANAADGGYWKREPGGPYAPHWDADHPMTAVSWNDLQLFVAWTNEHAADNGDPWTYALPSVAQIDAVRRVHAGRTYPYGQAWRPHWLKTPLSTATQPVMSEPVMSYPIDEYPHGVFDLGGSVVELTADLWSANDQMRTCIGGGHRTPEALFFESNGAFGHFRTDASIAIGFRLAATRRAD